MESHDVWCGIPSLPCPYFPSFLLNSAVNAGTIGETVQLNWVLQGIIGPVKQDLVANLKLNRSAFSVASLTDESDEKAYWFARTPYERLRQVEILRRINYGYRAASRLQRVLEITERETG
jgi:hypothetical protein